MSVDLVVIGAGGFGRETLDVIEAYNKESRNTYFNVLGVIDDAPQAQTVERIERQGYRILGDIHFYLEHLPQVHYLLGIGSPRLREEIAHRCDEAGRIPATVVHPRAVLGSCVRIGEGSVICSGVQVSTNVTIGRHVHLNPAAVIGHDTSLEDFVSVNPRAVVSGEVSVSEGVLVGAGAVILQGLQIGPRAVIGASACVTRDVESERVMVGVPARQSHGQMGTKPRIERA